MAETRQIKHTLRYVADRMLAAERASRGIATAMTAPPTITLSGHNAASTIAGGVYVPAGSTVFSFLGSVPAVTSIPGASWNGYSALDIYYPGAVNIGAGVKRGGQMDVVFGYAGRYLEICARGGSSVVSKACRIWVDGHPTALLPRNDLDGTSKNQSYALDFGSAAPRSIRFEMDPFCGFGGVIREPNYDVWALPTTGPRLLCVGDSFCYGASADFLMTNMFRSAAQRLGILDAWNQSEGGLGYLDNGANSLLNARQKLASEVLPYNPDWVIVALGINDAGEDPAAVGAEVQLYFDALLAGLPYAGITVIGPWRTPGLAPSAAVKDAIKSAIASRPGYGGRLAFVDTYADNWQQVAGRVGAVSGVGNSNVYIGADNTHPVQAGHDYLGARVASAVLGHLRSVTA